jgi:hypothetical protein
VSDDQLDDDRLSWGSAPQRFRDAHARQQRHVTDVEAELADLRSAVGQETGELRRLTVDNAAWKAGLDVDAPDVKAALGDFEADEITPEVVPRARAAVLRELAAQFRAGRSYSELADELEPQP